jgi:hypothetical protein
LVLLIHQQSQVAQVPDVDARLCECRRQSVSSA